MVEFHQANLMDPESYSILPKCDVVFCRNVFIYFSQAAKRDVVEGIHSVLREGGFLLMGHSESLLNITTLFQLVHLKNDMVYQKEASSTHSTDKPLTELHQ